MDILTNSRYNEIDLIEKLVKCPTAVKMPKGVVHIVHQEETLCALSTFRSNLKMRFFRRIDANILACHYRT